MVAHSVQVLLGDGEGKDAPWTVLVKMEMDSNGAPDLLELEEWTWANAKWTACWMWFSMGSWVQTWCPDVWSETNQNQALGYRVRCAKGREGKGSLYAGQEHIHLQTSLVSHAACPASCLGGPQPHDVWEGGICHPDTMSVTPTALDRVTSKAVAGAGPFWCWWSTAILSQRHKQRSESQ